MQEYKIIAEYAREGKTYHDRWFARAENGDDAIELIKDRFNGLNAARFAGAKDATFSIEEIIDLPETHKREESDTLVSIGHPNLVDRITGYAREVETKDGKSWVLIFIPTGVGNSLIDLIKVEAD